MGLFYQQTLPRLEVLYSISHRTPSRFPDSNPGASCTLNTNTKMRIWTSEHIFNHNWETVTVGQWRKYPNPHNQAVVGTDVVDRKVVDGVLHSHRIISSDWGLAEWVQKLIGANKVCYASEVSRVDPKNRLMEMHSKNLSFCNFVNMEEKMTYSPDPLDTNKTVMRQETVVTVQGVPLTSYMEGIIVNTVSSNSSKGRAAIEWIVEKLGNECRALSLSSSLEKLKSEYVDLKHQVAESIINPAQLSIEELQGELKIDLERLSKFELAKLGSLELAKLRELQLSLPSPPTLKAEENPGPSL